MSVQCNTIVNDVTFEHSTSSLESCRGLFCVIRSCYLYIMQWPFQLVGLQKQLPVCASLSCVKAEKWFVSQRPQPTVFHSYVNPIRVSETGRDWKPCLCVDIVCLCVHCVLRVSLWICFPLSSVSVAPQHVRRPEVDLHRPDDRVLRLLRCHLPWYQGEGVFTSPDFLSTEKIFNHRSSAVTRRRTCLKDDALTWTLEV